MEASMEQWKKNLRLLWATQVISLMSFGFGLPFIPLYMKELEVLTQAQVDIYATLLAIAPAITMGIMAPIWGHLADRFGRKLMILRAMFFAVFIIGGMGLVTSVNQLVLLRLFQGLFTGTVTAAYAFIASNTPEKHITYALGHIASSTFIGYAIGPMIGAGVVEGLKLIVTMETAYRISFFVGGGLMIIGALSVLFILKEDKSTLKSKSKHKTNIIKEYKKIIIPVIVLALGMLFMLRVSRSVFAPYVALFVEKNLINKEYATLITGVITGLVGLSTASASMLIGKLSYKLDKKKLMFIMLTASLFLSVMMTQYQALYQSVSSVFTFVKSPLLIFIPLYMLFYFTIGGVEPLITSKAALAVNSEDRGALAGLQGMVGSMAWAAAPMMAGPVVLNYSYDGVLFLVPIVVMINMFLSVALNRH
jgi:DHA1 family multidrug resistance protein-like MFS transporter